jgi:hypothetical protein
VFKKGGKKAEEECTPTRKTGGAKSKTEQLQGFFVTAATVIESVSNDTFNTKKRVVRTRAGHRSTGKDGKTKRD